MEPKEIKVGDYVEIFSPEWAGGWSVAKCLNDLYPKTFQLHNSRVVLDETEIREFGERTTKPLWGTEYE